MSEDLETTLRRMTETKVNRRGFLDAAGLTGAAAAIAACTPGSSSLAGRLDRRQRRSRRERRPERGRRAPPRRTASRPPATSKKSCSCTTGASTSRPTNIEAFKAKYGITKFQYDIYDSNDVLLAKLQGGATGYDIASPTAEYVPGMVEQGFVQKLDKSRLPNLANIDPKFKGLWWDPNDEYQIPKDFGTTGVLYRTTMIPTPRQELEGLLRPDQGPGLGQDGLRRLDGRRLRLPAQDARLLGQLGREGRARPGRARSCSMSRRTCSPSTRTSTARRWPRARRRWRSGWTGVLTQDMADTPDKGYVVPSEGTIFWLDTWVLLADAPHPERGVRLARLHPRPRRSRPRRPTTTSTARRTTRPSRSSTRRSWPTRRSSRPMTSFALLEGSKDTSANTQRTDIWEEFKQKLGG